MGGYHQLPVTPFNPPDPMEQFSRAMALKNMLQNAPLQHQALQQQVQSGQLGLEQQQMSMQSQQAMMKAYTEANGNLEQAVPLAAKYGAMPGDVEKLRNAARDQQKANLDLLQKKGERALQEADWMQGAHDAVAKAPPEQRPQIWQQQVQALAQAGVDVSQVPQQYPGDQAFSILGIGLKGHKQQLEDLAKQAEVRKSTAEAGKAEMEATAMQQYGGGNQQMADAKYRFLQQKIAAKQQISPEDRNFVTAYEKQKLLVPSTSARIRVEGFGDIRGIPVTDTKTGVTSYMNWNDYNKVSHAEPGRYTAPQYDPNAQMSVKAWRDLSPGGKTGTQVTSYNTFLQHAGQLWDAIDELQNSGYPDLNKPLNWYRTHTGDPRVQTFLAKLEPVQKEFESFLLGNRALYSEDREDAKRTLDQNASPLQMRGVLQSIIHTGSARLEEQNNSFKRATGEDIPNLVSPNAQNAMDKISGKSGQGAAGKFQVLAPDGKTYSFSTKEKADAFKKLAGIK